jgi:hypothetical protein
MLRRQMISHSIRKMGGDAIVLELTFLAAVPTPVSVRRRRFVPHGPYLKSLHIDHPTTPEV